MPKTLRIKDYRATCDATNNPPNTFEKQLNIRLQVQFEDQGAGNHFWIEMLVPLRRLRDGKLKTVKVGYVGR
jgi:hypothetical protein